MLALLASCQPLAVSGQRNYIFDFTDTPRPLSARLLAQLNLLANLIYLLRSNNLPTKR